MSIISFNAKLAPETDEQLKREKERSRFEREQNERLLKFISSRLTARLPWYARGFLGWRYNTDIETTLIHVAITFGSVLALWGCLNWFLAEVRIASVTWHNPLKEISQQAEQNAGHR